MGIRKLDPLGGSSDSALSGPVGAALRAVELAGQAMELAGLAAAAAGYAQQSKAPNTRRAYRSDWAHFAEWCALAGLPALPADGGTVGLYLTAHAVVLSVATLRRRLACIGQAHRAAGHESPTKSAACRAVWAGISRAHARPAYHKTPLVVEAMRAVLQTLDESPRGKRDRALLLLGWGAALRRSELVGLDRGDIAVADGGIVLTIRAGKTLAPGDVRHIGIPRGQKPATCPVDAYWAWQLCLPQAGEAFFRGIDQHGHISPHRLVDRQVARVVKRVADRAGLQGDYSGHSLRAGLATSAAAAGASERSIMAQTGHRSLQIARQYIRPASLFADNAAAIAAL